MGNVLKPFPKGSIHIIRGLPYTQPIDPDYQVNHPQTYVKFPKWYKRDGHRIIPFLYTFMMTTALKLHRKHKFSAVYGCWPTHWHLEFAYRFHRIARIPLYIHMHDMWAENLKSQVGKKIGRIFEKRIFRAADTVFAITDAAGSYFKNNYGSRTYTLEHSVDWSVVKQPYRFHEIVKKRSLHKIIHLGDIYPMMNQDSVIRINQAVQQISKAEMIIYNRGADGLDVYGLIGERINKKALPKSEVIAHLQRASIVCVPLSFNSWAKSEIDTVFPTRCLDFFVCGRPILVHAPRSSFIAKDARKRKWGFVVDKPDVEELKIAIEYILINKELQKQLVNAAWHEAKRRESIIISKKLQKYLGVI